MVGLGLVLGASPGSSLPPQLVHSGQPGAHTTRLPTRTKTFWVQTPHLPLATGRLPHQELVARTCCTYLDQAELTQIAERQHRAGMLRGVAWGIWPTNAVRGRPVGIAKGMLGAAEHRDHPADIPQAHRKALYVPPTHPFKPREACKWT